MDYRVASNIRGKSLSSLITDKIVSGKGVGSALGGAISDKLKARATGVKEKFDPMNIAKFMTGGSRLGPAIMGRLTGRSQSDINYFAGDKRRKESYTQVPTSLSTPGEGLGGSAVEVLNKMLAFMQRTREDDLKKRDTSKQFIEEQKVEEQRRHKEFLDVLKEYTLLNSTTLVGKTEEGPGPFEFLKDMLSGLIDKMLQPFKWLLDNKDKIFGILRWAAGPLGMALLGTGAIVWLAEQLKDYFRENVANMNVISPEKAAELLQTPGAYREIEKYGGREAVLKIAKEGHLEAAKILASGDIKKINDAGGKDFLEKVVARGAVKVPESATNEDLSQFAEQGPKRPKGTGTSIPTKQADWDKKWSKIYDPETGKRLDLLESKPVPTQSDVRKIDNAAMATPVTPTQSDVRKIDNATESTPIIPTQSDVRKKDSTDTATPVMPTHSDVRKIDNSITATLVPQTPVSSRMNDVAEETTPSTTRTETTTPVPQTPISSRMNEAVQENQALNIAPTVNTQTSPAILTNNTSSVDLPDRPIPATATVRDKTPILDYVFGHSLAPV